MATKQKSCPTVSIIKTVSVYPNSLHPHELLSLSKLSVYPNSLHPHELSLSNLDRQCPVLMYLVFFYKPSDNLSHGTTFRSLFYDLKAGLEETLSVWYPAAGRLTFNPTDGKLDVLCDNAGAVLVEAVTEAKISDMGDLSQYNKFYENLVFKPGFNGNFSESPLVIGQVTKFGCGGSAIGIGASHSLFDGRSMFDFLTAWASKTTMKDVEGVELLEPVHERGRLLVGQRRIQHLITNSCENKPASAVKVSAFDHLHQLIKQAASDGSLDLDGKLGGCKFSEMGCSNQENHILKTFRISSAMIEFLKRNVFGLKSHTHTYSSFEVVAAHLWKARIRALGLGKERIVCLQFAVDTRNKMVTPLPEGFSGNAYVLASITCTAGELEELNYEAIVEKIKEAKRSVNDDYVSAYLEGLEGPQATLPPLRELTLVSDWTRTPFHKVDFGQGEAIYASPLIPPLPQVAYFMQSPNETNGIDVRIGLLPQHLHAFTHHFLTKFQ